MVATLARQMIGLRPYALGILAAFTVYALFAVFQGAARGPAIAVADMGPGAPEEGALMHFVVMAAPGTSLDSPDGRAFLRRLIEAIAATPRSEREGPAFGYPREEAIRADADGRTAVLPVPRLEGAEPDMAVLTERLTALARDSGPGPRFRAELLSEEGAAQALASERLPAIVLIIVSALVLGAGLLAYSGSFALTGLALASALLTVLWQMGLWAASGRAYSESARLLAPLVLAAALTHAFPMARHFLRALQTGATAQAAAVETVARLGPAGWAALWGGSAALIAAAIPPIASLREAAMFGALGLALAAPAMFLVLPLFLASMPIDRPLPPPVEPRRRVRTGPPLTPRQAGRARETVAVIAAALAVVAAFESTGRDVGPVSTGLDALPKHAPWNEAAEAAAQGPGNPRASLSIVARTSAETCTKFEVLDSVDRLSWRLLNIEGVTAVESLPIALRRVATDWHDGDPRWRDIPRNPLAVVQGMAALPKELGLFTPRCDALAIHTYVAAPVGPALERVALEVERFAAANDNPDLNFTLAGGPLAGPLAERTLINRHEGTVVISALAAVIALLFVGLADWRAAPAVAIALGLGLLAAGWTLASRPLGLTPETVPLVLFAIIMPADIVAYALLATREASDDKSPARGTLWRHLWRRDGQALAARSLAVMLAFTLWFVSPDRVQAETGLLITITTLVVMLATLFVLPAIVPAIEEALARRSRQPPPP